MKATLFADGGSRGNPGPAASGAVLFDGDGTVLAEIGEYLGIATNNVAEWSALVSGLERARELGVEDLAIRMDSELVVRQVTGVYRVKHADLIPLQRTSEEPPAQLQERRHPPRPSQAKRGRRRRRQPMPRRRRRAREGCMNLRRC